MKNILTLILGLIGFAISLKLAFIYYDANLGGGGTGHFCTLNSVVDCNGVAQSSYSSFLGIPLAIYGMLFYLGIIALSVFDRIKEKLAFLKEFAHPLSYMHLMSIFSLFVSAALAYISTVKIHKICLLCYITYGINALIFIVLAKQSLAQSIKFTLSDSLNFANKLKNQYILPFLSLFLILVLMLFNQTQILVPSHQEMIDRGNTLGNPDSPLKITVYTDYNCPYCAKENANLQRLVKNIKEVRVEKVEFPLDGHCNPQYKKMKNHSCLAAKYALASKNQGKYVLMSSLLFENRHDLSEKNILKVAEKHGIDAIQLKEDAHSLQVAAELEKQIQRSTEEGITSVPVSKIGVKIYNYYLPYNELYQIVQEYKNVVY